MVHDSKLHIAVIGSGAAGLSAAWLLSKRHNVILLEQEGRLGGHAHTMSVPGDSTLKIDTGFIVYNEPSYLNLTQWFNALGVATQNSDMSFSVSRDNGNFEYAGGPALGLLAQPMLPLRRRFWRMLLDLLRFYRQARLHIPQNSEQSLGDFLEEHHYSSEFIQDHLLPFGAAIWSTSKNRMLDYPAASFIRFCDNHGLLQIIDRPQWKTVTGGSESYVNAVRQAIGDESIVTNFKVSGIERSAEGVIVRDGTGRQVVADHVVIATHADQALACLDDPDQTERSLLSQFEYESNLAILHTDIAYLPKRRRAWCSWNYVEKTGSNSSQVSVSYWMNNLQNIKTDTQYVVTLNPDTLPDDSCVLRSQYYDHPVFTRHTWTAQQQLWSLQGKNRTWFCGSYFGSGFHEDAVQAGFAVAESLGGLARPWTLKEPSNRIVVPSTMKASMSRVAA